MKKNSPNSSQANAKQKRIFITLAIVIGIPLILWGSAEIIYQLRVQKLVHAVQDIGETSLKKLGGVEIGSGIGVECPHFTDSLVAFDSGPCPSVGTGWLVPVTEDQKKSLITSALNDTGYRFDAALVGQGSGGGIKDGVGVQMELTGIGWNKEPYPLPAGKEWIGVNLRANY